MWREKEKGNHNKGITHNNMALLFLRMASIWKEPCLSAPKHLQILTGTGPSASRAAKIGKAKDGRTCAISKKNKEKRRIDSTSTVALHN